MSRLWGLWGLLLALYLCPAWPAQRIVSLAPHLTEMLFAAGAGSRVVATVKGSDYPTQARRLPRVGDASSVDFERIVALKPDLVLAWAGGTPVRIVAKLKALGLRVEESRVTGLGGVPDELERIGRLAGTPVPAVRAAAKLRRRIADLARRYAGRRPVRVFYQVWDHPLYTVGGQHFISDVLARCGAVNIYADLREPAGVVGRETVLVRDPQAIVAGADARTAARWFAEWSRYGSLTAVRLGHMGAVPPDLLEEPGPRLVYGAERLCALLDGWR